METVFCLGSRRRPDTAPAGRDTPSIRNTGLEEGQRHSAQPPASGQTGRALGSASAGAGQSSGTMRNRAQGHLHNDHRLRGRNRPPSLILRTRALRRGRLRSATVI